MSKMWSNDVPLVVNNVYNKQIHTLKSKKKICQLVCVEKVQQPLFSIQTGSKLVRLVRIRVMTLKTWSWGSVINFCIALQLQNVLNGHWATVFANATGLNDASSGKGKLRIGVSHKKAYFVIPLHLVDQVDQLISFILLLLLGHSLHRIRSQLLNVSGDGINSSSVKEECYCNNR